MDEIYGISLAKLAELGSKYSEFQAKFADAEATRAFEEWLTSQGTDSSSYWLAHKGWMARYRADPTGQLEARYHAMLAEHSQRIHFGDVRDMSRDEQEGVTLERYAELSVAMAKPGADADAIARQLGLSDAAHWQRVNSAWSNAMSRDTDFKLTTQFGALYQKYAGPSFAEQQLNETAAVLAGANQPRDGGDEPTTEQTPEVLLERLSSPTRAERWQAARRLAHAIDIGQADGGQYRAACVRVLVEILERHDEHTASDAEDAARRLVDIGERTSDVRGSMTRCLRRAQDELASLEVAFAPIQHAAVPERLVLRTRIDVYRSLVASLHSYLDDFQQSPVASFAPPAIAPLVARRNRGGWLGLIAPLAAIVLLAGGGLALWLNKKAPSEASLSAALPAVESATPTPSAAPLPSLEPSAAPAALPVPSATPAHTGRPVKHKSKPKH